MRVLVFFARLGSQLLTLAALLGLVGIWFVVQWEAPGPLLEDRTVVVPRGGVGQVAAFLADEGIIGEARLFWLAARARESGRGLRAGEYLFPAGISVLETLALLRSGKTVVRRFTVPEGLTVMAVVALLAEETALSGLIDTVPAEGSLLPETYHFSLGDDRNALLLRMQMAMQSTLDTLWAGRAPRLPLKTPEQALVLASVVEKETGLAHERGRVAGVFINRLNQGMKLQSDPTVAYALTLGVGSLERPLNRTDWKLDSPFNTYKVEGLPPSPIANPGRAALEAVLHPESHDFLYFVADGSGGHAFARTLAEHNRHVAAWRQAQQPPPPLPSPPPQLPPQLPPQPPS